MFQSCWWQAAASSGTRHTTSGVPCARRSCVPARLDGLADTVLTSLTKAPRLQPFAPLLCDILPLPIAQTQVTRQMDAAARATMTAQLLLHLVRDAPHSRLLIFEDAHWIDSTSWLVIAMAERQLAGHRLILTMRPEAMLPREASEFANRHRPQGIHLDGLSEADCSARRGAPWSS